MEIIGIGTEIVECARVRALIEQHGERFLTRVYTAAELRFCQSRKNSTEHYAAIWSAKEAVFKALNLAGRGGAPWSQVEITHSGVTPVVSVQGALKTRMATAGVGGFLLTTAFTRHYATATAIAQRAAAG